MNLKKFFSELKRRNIYKVGLTYAIVAWILAQIASLAADSFQAPQWVMKMIIVVLFLGFPVAVILAWAFEMSPEGIIRASSEAAEENPYSPSQKKPLTSNAIILVLLMALVGQFIFNKYSQKRGFDPSDTEKSIAVLPFRNDSPNQENMYFCNGIMEGILDHLSRVPELTVVSRTSVEQYRENPPSMNKIAEELGVNYLVEGSVQRQGDEVVIFAQLIYAKDDKHIWSHRYDEDVSKLFEVQANVTESIADNLEAVISPELKKQIEEIPTENTLAYDYYLRGKEYYNLANLSTQKNEDWDELLDKATLSLDMAIEKDSLFAEAIVGKAFVYFYRYNSSGRVDKGYLDQILILANKAIEINPNFMNGYWVRGWYYFHTDQIDLARKDFDKSLELAPKKNDILWKQFSIYMNIDLDFLKALRSLKKIEKISLSDDDLIQLYNGYIDFYASIDDHGKEEYYWNKLYSIDKEIDTTTWYLESRKGRLDNAIELYKKLRSQNNQLRNGTLGMLYFFNREFQKSHDYYKKWYEFVKVEDMQISNSARTLHRYGYTLMRIGNEEEGLKLIRTHIANDENLDKIGDLNIGNNANIGNMYDMIGSYASLDEKEKAYYWMERFDSMNGWLIWGSSYSWFLIDPLFDNLREDQKFKDWLANGNRQLDSIRNAVDMYLLSEEAD